MLHDFYHPIEERMIAADINKLINDVLTLQHHSFKLAQIKLITNLDPALPKVLASEDQLKQVFINMVANAQDAMREGGELIISTNNEKDNVAISFSDTGLGIPAANKEKIFEAFFTTKKEVKGVGLGLSVSYGIILRHRGSITVEDVSPHGAKFIIRLPVSPIGEPNES